MLAEPARHDLRRYVKWPQRRALRTHPGQQRRRGVTCEAQDVAAEVGLVGVARVSGGVGLGQGVVQCA